MEKDLIKKANMSTIIIAIIALLAPILVAAIAVQQTQENKKDIESLQDKYTEIGSDISAIKVNIVWIKEAVVE